MPNRRVQEVANRLLYRKIGHDHNSFTAGMVKRIKPDKTKITTESLDFEAPHSAKTKQAWRYAGSKIVRAPTLKLGSKRYVDPKSKGGEELPRRKQESNFFLTINTNKAPGGDLLDVGIKHMEAMLNYLSEETVMASYLKFGPKDDSYIEDKFADVIHSIDWKGAVETGDSLKRLHAHVWLTITHYSQIQINVQMLMHLARKAYNKYTTEQRNASGTARKVYVEEELPFGSPIRIQDNPYVHVKLLPQSDWTTVMRQYIHKGMEAA